MIDPWVLLQEAADTAAKRQLSLEGNEHVAQVCGTWYTSKDSSKDTSKDTSKDSTSRRYVAHGSIIWSGQSYDNDMIYNKQ